MTKPSSSPKPSSQLLRSMSASLPLMSLLPSTASPPAKPQPAAPARPSAAAPASASPKVPAAIARPPLAAPQRPAMRPTVRQASPRGLRAGRGSR